MLPARLSSFIRVSCVCTTYRRTSIYKGLPEPERLLHNFCQNPPNHASIATHTLMVVSASPVITSAHRTRSDTDDAAPPSKRRLQSTIIMPSRQRRRTDDTGNGEDSAASGAGRNKRGGAGDQELEEGETGEGETEEGQLPDKKRPSPPAKGGDPETKPAAGQRAYQGKAVKQRNRRMFGALMGHMAQAATRLKKDASVLGKQGEMKSLAVKRNVDRSDQLGETIRRDEQAKRMKEVEAERRHRDGLRLKREITELALLATHWEEHYRRMCPQKCGRDGTHSRGGGKGSTDGTNGSGRDEGSAGSVDEGSDTRSRGSAGDTPGGRKRGEEQLVGFLLTKTTPRLYWKPSRWDRRRLDLLDDRSSEAEAELVASRERWSAMRDGVRAKHERAGEERRTEGGVVEGREDAEGVECGRGVARGGTDGRGGVSSRSPTRTETGSGGGEVNDGDKADGDTGDDTCDADEGGKGSVPRTGDAAGDGDVGGENGGGNGGGGVDSTSSKNTLVASPRDRDGREKPAKDT